jgi:hypothetical protein
MITAKYLSLSLAEGFVDSSFVWWTAQALQRQPADRDATDRAGSYDGNDNLVSAPDLLRQQSN